MYETTSYIDDYNIISAAMSYFNDALNETWQFLSYQSLIEFGINKLDLSSQVESNQKGDAVNMKFHGRMMMWCEQNNNFRPTPEADWYFGLTS